MPIQPTSSISKLSLDYIEVGQIWFHKSLKEKITVIAIDKTTHKNMILIYYNYLNLKLRTPNVYYQPYHAFIENFVLISLNYSKLWRTNAGY